MKKQSITMPILQRAANNVQAELHSHGLWTRKVWRVNVYLIPFAFAEGLFYGYNNGYIHIPGISTIRLMRVFGYPSTGLHDVLRHEYMHAVQHAYSGLLRSAKVSKAFGRSVFANWRMEYDKELNVSNYSCKNGWEHFAETGMCFLKHKGKCPRRWKGTQIEDQFTILSELGGIIEGHPAGF